MVGELLIGVSLFKSMLDMTKGLKDMNDAAVRNAAVIDLQGQILAAQEQQMVLVERVSELEKEVANFETWDAEKERYELTKVGDDAALAYTLKEGMESSEPSHQLCANCYSDGKKSILQKEIRHNGRSHLLICHRCKAEIYTFGENPTGAKPKGGTFGKR